MDGHSGDVYFVAFHPTKPNIFATVSDSGHAHLWDAGLRQMTHCVPLGWDPRAIAFSQGPLGASGGFHVAVGSQFGQVKVREGGEGNAGMIGGREGYGGMSWMEVVRKVRRSYKGPLTNRPHRCTAWL